MFEFLLFGSKKVRCFIVLFDYDLYSLFFFEYFDLEFKFKEGDFLIVFGDMDINGYLEVDLNGEWGLVFSLYVEEVEDVNDFDIVLED